MNATFARRGPDTGGPLLAQLRAIFPGGHCACGCAPARHEFGSGSRCNDLVCLEHPGRVCGNVFGAGEHHHDLMRWLRR